MLIKKAHELRVYQLAFQLALEVHKASLEFPKIEQYALADQMRRASKSICANIAEGFAKQPHSKPEFKRFLMMAKCRHGLHLRGILATRLNHWLLSGKINMILC